MADKQRYCYGCDDDSYNGHNSIGIEQCWHLKTAKVVTRYCIGWWIPMDSAKNFRKVKTLACHTESGRVAFLQDMPIHLASEWREQHKVKAVRVA